mmetsp:Transcript_20885/g.34473  ORF Transcript_20885/g.34473 Transcript_20885/m.34473 type:complete len:368 (-) Transcript_20885:140-1243(-)|eukprot:scaffold1366_cov155-Skeletonema_menzelii.AAC.11
MKKSKATVSKPPSASALQLDSESVNTKSNTGFVFPSKTSTATSTPSGLDLLFAASQVEPTSKAKLKEGPSTITVVSRDTEGNYGSKRDAEETFPSEHAGNFAAIAALKTQDKSFPQVLHEILAEPGCQSIVHWLPNGSSFIIADKQRFSGEILPKYFRVTLLNSFIRKLNRWGFRRVKSSCKGEESSFAHINFVRDKPWLCLKMWCKSKPSFSVEKKTKAEARPAAEATSMNSLDNVRSVQPHAPPRSLTRAFVPTYSRMAVSKHAPLPLPRPDPTLLTAPAAGFLSAVDASTIQERQCLASILPYHQQRIYLERQMLIAQMHQQHHLDVELQRLTQYQYARDMLCRRNMNYREERGNESMRSNRFF